MKKLIASVAIAFAATVNASGLPEGEFRDPSVANRPETWFHFIGGNVAKPGITADLEAIKGAGISGIHLFSMDSSAANGPASSRRSRASARRGTG